MLIIGSGASEQASEESAKLVVEKGLIFTDEVDAASKINIGYGLDGSVQMGPVRDKDKKENILRYIESGVQQGAKLSLDGRENLKIIGDYPQTCFLGPTVFDNVTTDMKIGVEEILPCRRHRRLNTVSQSNHPSSKFPFPNRESSSLIHRVSLKNDEVEVRKIAEIIQLGYN